MIGGLRHERLGADRNRAVESGIPFEVLHSLTTADAPETVRHVYDTFYRLECKGIKCDVDKHVQPDGFCAYRLRNDGADVGKAVFLTREEAMKDE